MPRQVWIGTIEVSIPDAQKPSVMRYGFINITTWAGTREEFQQKCTRMFESYGWKLLGLERANPVPDDAAFNEEVAEMLERTRANPNAIIYGTFHTYRLT